MATSVYTNHSNTNVFHSCLGIQIGDRHYYRTRVECEELQPKGDKRGYHHLVGGLLNSSQDVNARTDQGITPLHLAVADGNTDVLLTILEHKPEINPATHKHGLTPLHIACALDRKDITDLLVQHGADQEMRDKDGWLAIHYSSASGYKRMSHIMEEMLGIPSAGPNLKDSLSAVSFESCLSADPSSTTGSFYSVHEFISTDDIRRAGDVTQFHEARDWHEKSTREIFSLFDLRKDGKISLAELTEVIQFLKIRVTPPEIEAMVNVVDVNGNGVVDYEEFIMLINRYWAEADGSWDRPGALFDIFDADGNGVIDRGEITRVMQNLGVPITDEDLTEMLREADINGDGQIDKAEFQKLLENLKGMAAP